MGMWRLENSHVPIIYIDALRFRSIEPFIVLWILYDFNPSRYTSFERFLVLRECYGWICQPLPKESMKPEKPKI